MSARAAAFGGVLGAAAVIGFGLYRIKRELNDEGDVYKEALEEKAVATVEDVARDQVRLSLAAYGITPENMRVYKSALARLGIAW